MTVTDGREIVDFMELWFQSEQFADEHTVAVVNSTVSNCPTIGLGPFEWRHRVTEDGDLTTVAQELRMAFDGLAQVFPWFLIPASHGVGPLRAETMPGRKCQLPGFYVDVTTGRDSGDRVLGFATLLESMEIGPTLVTVETAGNERWRFWWRVDDFMNMPPRKFTFLNGTPPEIAHLAWSTIIQRYAIKFGFAPVLSFNPRFRHGWMLYRLPGIDAMIVHRGSRLDWRTATYHGIEERMEEISELRRGYGESFWTEHMGLFTAENEPPWDWVLNPMGWRCVGHGDTVVTDHWRSPGGETIATTEGRELYLRRKHSWNCGLKEISDAGIRMDKRVVACVLGWDGERAEFIDHWTRTGTLYE